VVTTGLIHREHLAIFTLAKESQLIEINQHCIVAFAAKNAPISQDDINLNRITPNGEVRQAYVEAKYASLELYVVED
jgi:hypothetical protein